MSPQRLASAGFDGSRAWRWRPFAFCHVFRTLTRVFLGARQIDSLAGRFCLAGGALLKEFFQEGAAPATASACAEALAQLTFSLGLIHPDVIYNLPPSDVKAQAEFVVGFHVQPSVAVARRKPMRQAV